MSTVKTLWGQDSAMDVLFSDICEARSRQLHTWTWASTEISEVGAISIQRTLKPWHWGGSRRSECGERRGRRAEPWATAALRSRELRGKHSGEGTGELDGVFPGGKCERVQGKVGSVELQ